MKCINCGTELREDAKFCKACGCQVKEAERLVKVKQDAPVTGIFSELHERIRQAERTYAKLEEENQALKRLLMEKSDLIEKLLKENENAKKTAVVLQQQLSEKTGEMKELKACLEAAKNVEAPVEQKPKVLTCPNCHAPIDKNTIFCGECGTKIQ